ncbi:NAD(P)H-binding protein [Plantactinospora sp. B24E8]|uniref:SDR family oxidoreductase n=1 Tax=Plantactinospora sp. B24E8 TaxID=3153567 RepID=UPI00325F876B
MTVLVTGATGRLGRVLTPTLAGYGHPTRAMSRTPKGGDGVDRIRADLATGEGLAAALDGVETVVHLASAPYQRGYTRQVDVDGTRRLVDTAGPAGVRHLVYVSIVGIDRVPWSYYRLKLDAEAIVAAGPVPWTILRVTQFHDLIDEALTRLARFPVLPVDPKIVGQPVDVHDVAAHLVRRISAPATRTIEEYGGPEVLGLADVARAWLAARGVRRPLLRLPVPGRFGRELRAGALTTDRGDRGRITWSDYLAGRSAGPG